MHFGKNKLGSRWHIVTPCADVTAGAGCWCDVCAVPITDASENPDVKISNPTLDHQLLRDVVRILVVHL